MIVCPRPSSRPCRAAAFALTLASLAGLGCADRSEDVIRHNSLGTAYLGQQKWSDAEREFRQAIELGPDDPLPLNNLAVTLVQQGRIDEAEIALDEALVSDPDNPWAHYNAGLIEKNRGDFATAVGHFEAVRDHDPEDLLTQYNLGVVYARLGRDEEALAAFRNALDRNPAHVSTLYGLGRFLLQKGDTDEGARLVALSQEIRARSGLDEAVGTQYGEQGPYALGVDYPGDALPAPPDAGAPRFEIDASGEGNGTAWTLTRLGADGPPRVVAFAGSSLAALGAGDWSADVGRVDGEVLALAAGDVDGDEDGTIELLVATRDDDGIGWRLFAPDASGRFAVLPDERLGGLGADQSIGGALNGLDATFVDVDHDGDLDAFWCWTTDSGAGCRLATNDALGQFEVRDSSDHGFAPVGHSGRVHVSFSDADNDRDIDLLVTSRAGVSLFSNQRDGTWRDVSDDVGLGHRAAGAAALTVADLDKDGWMDLVLGGADGVRVASNLRGSFTIAALPGEVGQAPSEALVIFDYDNDGFLDVASASLDGPTAVYRNLGVGEWSAGRPADEGGQAGAPLAAIDADRDGRLDLVTRKPSGELALWRNAGASGHHYITVDPVGVGDNRYGIGTKVELLAGALRQKFEVGRPLPIHAGLGSRETVESVRLLWPGGVLQDEIQQPVDGAALITQLDRKGTSCPLLYAWRDGGWHFVTDFLGGAAVGYQKARGVFGVPDTDEYVLIEGGLTPNDEGRLRLRINNQLEEVLWFDQLELVVVDHPAGTTLVPDERLMPGPPFPPFQLFASDDVRPVVAARSLGSGRELTSRLAERDRGYVDDFASLPYKGYAERHAIELDLGAFDATERVVLLLDGWIDYADSSSNIAAEQAGLRLVPPRLTVADGRGGWRETGHRMGFPAGLPKTMSVELTGLFPSDDHRVRIETNMRIYWDRARVMVGGAATELRVERIAARSAELRFGGFPQPVSPDGHKPLVYDPGTVLVDMGWKAHIGRYTAFGDVTELVGRIDDAMVTTRNGDEIELIFDAPPPAAAGWTRSYLLFADGFGKDMDPNSGGGERIAPPPFHGMPSYPYPDDVVPPPEAFQAGGRKVPPHPRGWPGALPQPLAPTVGGNDEGS